MIELTTHNVLSATMQHKQYKNFWTLCVTATHADGTTVEFKMYTDKPLSVTHLPTFSHLDDAVQLSKEAA